MSEKNSLAFYQDMKYRRGKEEEYTVCCTRAEGNWIRWLKAGVLKLREIRSGLDKGSCPLCFGKEDVTVSILLTCPETRKRRSQSMYKSQINHELTFRKKKTINWAN
jgi:hypothetical protein